MNILIEAQECVNEKLRMYAPHEHKRIIKGLIDEWKRMSEMVNNIDRDRLRYAMQVNDAQRSELNAKLAMNFAARQGVRAAEFLQDCMAGDITYEKWPDFVTETVEGYVDFNVEKFNEKIRGS